MIRRIAALPLPVIAAVNGVAAGAGANLALAADIVLAARGAKFIQSFAAIGLIPDTGGSYHLPRLIGQARALGLASPARPLSAEQAADWGLIRAVDDDALAAAAASLLLAWPPARAPAGGDQGGDPRCGSRISMASWTTSATSCAGLAPARISTRRSTPF